MKNVAGDPAHAKTVKKLREQLMAELKSTSDPRLVDGEKFFETPPMAGPFVGKKGQKKRSESDVATRFVARIPEEMESKWRIILCRENEFFSRWVSSE